MRKRHPLSALLYVWTLDLIGLAVLVLALVSFRQVTPASWLHFAVWTLLLCWAHIHGNWVFGPKVLTGWHAAIDFAAAMILPFPMFCLTVVVWCSVSVILRIRRKHPEPFLGPDFNAANLILDAGAAILVYNGLISFMGDLPVAGTVALLGAAVAFTGLQILLLTALLSLDFRKPWRKVGSLEIDALINDGMMVTAGALVCSIYQYDPYRLILPAGVLVFLAKAIRRLNEAKLAYIDGKTGLFNYRYFDEALATVFRKAVQTNKPLAVIFGDMDHLRDVNNNHGHLVGDKAIVVVAEAFGRVSIPGSIACRFGGEEFVLMLPGYDKTRAFEIAEGVRQAVATTPIPLESGGTLRCTISLGVAAFPEDAKTVEELVKAADEAVYDAKHAGRNRVSLHHLRQVAAGMAGVITYGRKEVADRRASAPRD